MYWRVRKISYEQILRQYGPYAALCFSLLFNFVLIVTRPSTPKVSAEIKITFEQFAKQVTQHLLDTSYITYKESTLELSDELAPNVRKLLMQQDMLAKTNDDLLATERALKEQRQVSAIRISDIIDRDLTPNGMLPVEVKGEVAIHSAQDAGPTGPVPFHFKFLIGQRASQDGKPSDNKAPQPIIVEFQDVSEKASSAAQPVSSAP